MRTWLSKRRGYRSQQMVAELAGISQNYYSCIETGARRPSVPTAKKLGEVLGFPWIWFFEPPAQPESGAPKRPGSVAQTPPQCR